MLSVAILIAAGGALIAKVPGIMPWPVKPEMSMVCGWVFVSAAWSFAYPLLRPQVEHVVVGLVGYLAYDAVLIVPFIKHLDNVRPELHRSFKSTCLPWPSPPVCRCTTCSSAEPRDSRHNGRM